MAVGGQGTKWCRKISENFNRLSRAHECSRRQTTDRRTGDDIIIANVNVSSRSLKNQAFEIDEKNEFHWISSQLLRVHAISECFVFTLLLKPLTVCGERGGRFFECLYSDACDVDHVAIGRNLLNKFLWNTFLSCTF